MTGPSFYLVYSQYENFNDQYYFTSQEIKGIEQLTQVMSFYKKVMLDIPFEKSELNDFIEKSLIEKNIFNVSKERLKTLKTDLDRKNIHNKEEWADLFFSPIIRFIANYSNLILDPELGPYYLMDITTLKIPRLFQLLSRKNVDYKFVKNEISDIQYALYILYNEDPQKSTILFEDSDKMLNHFSQIKSSFENELMNKNPDAEKDFILALHDFNISSMVNLKYLLELRNKKLKSDKLLVLKTAVVIWAIGIVLGFMLFISMGLTQDKLSDQVSSQSRLLEKNEKLTMLGEMAAGIAHEIASPIQVLQYANFKISTLAEDKFYEVHKYTAQIDKMLAQIKFIVKSIKAFSHHSDKSETVPVILKNALEEALLIVQFKLKEQGVRIILDESLDHVNVRATEPELAQIFVNLMNNSTDALEHTEVKVISISSQVIMDEFVEINVVDNGPGVPLDLQEKIFDSLFTTKDFGKGTGLGLSLSRKIAESHGGKLLLSPSKVGAHFKIILLKA